jgi:ATP-dependent Clp protease ATP-binding subunit ClpX
MSTGGSNSKNTLYARSAAREPARAAQAHCELCMDIIGEENTSSLVKSRDGIPAPKEICNVLDDYVISQDHTKNVLSVAVHNHNKRLNHQISRKLVEGTARPLYICAARAGASAS